METVRFRDLKVYETFEFEYKVKYPFSCLCAGPWRKLSARRYEHVTDGMVCNVGTINVAVKRVDYDPTDREQYLRAKVGV